VAGNLVSDPVSINDRRYDLDVAIASEVDNDERKYKYRDAHFFPRQIEAYNADSDKKEYCILAIICKCVIESLYNLLAVF